MSDVIEVMDETTNVEATSVAPESTALVQAETPEVKPATYIPTGQQLGQMFVGTAVTMACGAIIGGAMNVLATGIQKGAQKLAAKGKKALDERREKKELKKVAAEADATPDPEPTEVVVEATVEEE